MNAILALEDGSVFRGHGFGAQASASGEVCFNTSMTGYQEILTDPSYKGQIVTMTYPMIGNTGINLQDMESWKAHCSGFVIRELSPVVSNWRADLSLAAYLDQNGIPGIQGVDTRALTKKLRVRGALAGFLTTEPMSDADAVARARQWGSMEGRNYVVEVTHSESFIWDEKDQDSADFSVTQQHSPPEPTKCGCRCAPPTSPSWLTISASSTTSCGVCGSAVSVSAWFLPEPRLKRCCPTSQRVCSSAMARAIREPWEGLSVR
jgi:carbamoyl-phosphate synthase small subunit